MSINYSFRKHNDRELTDREKFILRSIVQAYILTASPVGSRFLSKYVEECKLSPATIRNVMADLEEMEFISHPHTSAGRVPTDKGYRLYVDSLMNIEHISESEQIVVDTHLLAHPYEGALKDASRILGSLSHYLAIVELPNLADIIVRQIQLMPLSSQRLLVVVELESKLVRTVTLETDIDIQSATLDIVSTFINSKISGKSLRYIRLNFVSILQEHSNFLHSSLFRLFVESVDVLFKPHQANEEKVHIAGTQNLLKYPEFDNPEHVRGIIELVESEDIIIHLLDRKDGISDTGIKVIIGDELGEEKLKNYSLVSGSYSISGANGSIGLIGPKRMNYSKMISLVEYVAGALSNQ
jgi:heat-inducible transcriptional repressor